MFVGEALLHDTYTDSSDNDAPRNPVLNDINLIESHSGSININPRKANFTHYVTGSGVCCYTFQ